MVIANKGDIGTIRPDYRYVTSPYVNNLAFMRCSPYLERDLGGHVQHKATSRMDDSRDRESSAARVWAAEGSGNEAAAVSKSAFTIGELSREFGVTLRALRFYENKGLISPHRDGLNRLYSQGDRTRLALILKGKKLGFTLGEIRQMIAAEENETDRDALTLSREKCLEQIELLQRQKAEIEEGLSELNRIYRSLSGKLGDQRPG